MIFARSLIAALCMACGAAAAQADVKSYCEALARDTADAAVGVTGVGTLANAPNDQWTAENDRALQECLTLYTQPQAAAPAAATATESVGDGGDAQATADAPAAQTQQAQPQAQPAHVQPAPRVAARVVSRGKPRMRLIASAHAPSIASTSPSQGAGSGGGLQPGTSAWNAYCARKYTSFNAATGSYKSYNGTYRRCKVTRH